MYNEKYVILNKNVLTNVYQSIVFLFLSNKVLSVFLISIKYGSTPKAFFFKIALFLLVFSILLTLFSTINFFKIHKGVIYFLYTISIIADYFMRTYGVVIDDTVFQSLFESSKTEIYQYYHLGFVLEISVFFVIFVFLFKKTKCKEINFFTRLKVYLTSMFLSIAIVAFVGVFFYKDFASFFRNNRQVRHLLNPINFLYQSYNFINFYVNKNSSRFVSISDDSKISSRNKPILFVFILGETARSKNFSLNGYHRATNPNLVNEQNLINFKNVTSCGTATAISVPCMFSDKNRNTFNKSKDIKRGNIIDILNKVGFDSIWVDNNTGCKGVCDRIKKLDLEPYKSSKICNSGGCYDEILNLAFEDIVDKQINIKSDKSIINNRAIYMHMLGSHGPTYYLRYPKEFEVFKPVCNTSRLSDCNKDDIINTYDNTIIYTEHVISNVIVKLKSIKEYDSLLIYMSDHGESLGERGVYLHSLPYFFAPEAQKKIPFFIWYSDSFFNNQTGLIKMIKKRSYCDLSHDNLFHTILGGLNIESKFYNSELDIFNTKFICNKY